ncbi:MAG: Uma2 family endonuclease [Candidatus Sericytochromatia bacterium]
MSLVLNKNLTYDDYLKIDDDKQYQLIEGVLILNPAPSSRHQKIVSNLSYFMSNFVRNSKLGEIYFAPYDVILDKNTVVQPDILFISNENIVNIKERGFFGTPDLVIEIISPSSLKRDIEDKRLIYQKFGIKEYWLVFPNEKAVEVLELVDSTYTVYDHAYTEDIDKEQKVKSKVLAGFEIDLKDIF